MEFEIGDRAYVPTHGIGVVKKIENVSIEGVDYAMYVIKVLDQGLTVKVPVYNTGATGVREVISVGEVDRVFAVLRNHDVPQNKQTWNRRRREFEAKILSGDFIEVAEVLRDLSLLKLRKTLSFGEKKMFVQAQSLVVQEVAVARDIDEPTVQSEIEAIFKTPAE